MRKRPPSASEVKAELRRQISEAVLCLVSAELSDEAIHDTRKKLKSARAKLRLLRAAVGREAYARENAALRDAARPLGKVRDAKVMLDTVNALLARKGTRKRRVLLDALRGRLQQAHAAARGDFNARHRAAAIANVLREVSRRIGRRRVRDRDGIAVSSGLERVYRSARKALGRVEREGSSDNLHELRKQVKYLREALEPFHRGRKAAKNAAKRADAIAALLGDDHDFFVLQENLAAAESSAHAHSDSLAQEIATLREKLEARAVKRGRKLLRSKPSRFTRRLAV